MSDHAKEQIRLLLEKSDKFKDSSNMFMNGKYEEFICTEDDDYWYMEIETKSTAGSYKIMKKDFSIKNERHKHGKVDPNQPVYTLFVDYNDVKDKY